MRRSVILSLALVALCGHSIATPSTASAVLPELAAVQAAQPQSPQVCRFDDLVKSDLIIAPENCDPGGTFLVSIPSGLAYSITPTPKVLIPLKDETGNRVLVIQSAESPGYTVVVDHVIIHPTPAEIETAPLDDKAKFLEWLKDHNRDEIYRDEAFVKVGDSPDPGPEPDPIPDPDGKPPIPESGFRVLILEESSERTELPVGQLAILTGKQVRDYLDKTCAKEPNGNSAYRIYDKDVDASEDYDVWKVALQRRPEEVPWVLISNGKTGFEGPLPKTSQEFLELCKKYEVP